MLFIGWGAKSMDTLFYGTVRITSQAYDICIQIIVKFNVHIPY